MNKGYVAFDLDGTIAKYDGWVGEYHIGDPIQPMINLIKEYLNAGVDVRILTARASTKDPVVINIIQDWCETHIGKRLKVSNEKDYQMIRLYDDRAVQVEKNTGRIIGGNNV